MKPIFNKTIKRFKEYLPLILIVFCVLYITASFWLIDTASLPFNSFIPYDEIELLIIVALLLPAASAAVKLGNKKLNTVIFILGNFATAIAIYLYTSEPYDYSEGSIYSFYDSYFLGFLFTTCFLLIIASLFINIKILKLIFAKYLKLNSEIFFVIIGMTLIFVALPIGAERYYSYQLEKNNEVDLLERINRIEKHMGGEKALSCDKDEIVRNVSKNIVRVVGVFSEGSGVVIENDGTIITNYHVVAGEPSPKIVFSDYSKYPAIYIGVDKHLDLAVLKIDKSTPDYLSFGDVAPFTLAPLTPVYSFGFPLGTDIVGGVTVQEGKFVSMRTMEGVDYLHTDLSLQEGQSGGALTDVCGNLLGLNQSSLAGASFSISNIDLFTSVFKLMNSEFDQTDIDIIEFKENESALEAVRAFYNYQVIHQLEKSFNLLAESYLDGLSFEKWSEGYENVVGIDLIAITQEDANNTIYVKFVSTDLEGSSKVHRYFEGTWQTEKIDDQWKLIKPKIKQIDDPDWAWFYE